MDKVLSARLDQTVVDELARMSRRLGISKKQLLEEAIRLRARARRSDLHGVLVPITVDRHCGASTGSACA